MHNKAIGLHNPCREIASCDRAGSTGFPVDSVLANLGLSGWKPVLTALVLPPVPLLLLGVLAARMMVSRRVWRAGWGLMFSVMVLLWLSSCIGVGQWLEQTLLAVPAPLTEEQVAKLKREGPTRKSVVLVLGGGRDRYAPEYAEPHLSARSMQRLHYGVWLSRRTGSPLMFSGGVGHAQQEGMPEAEIAARIAARDYGRPLKWVENASHDTRGNAAASLRLLKSEGIADIVLVTHGWHMPRARRAFEEAAQQQGLNVTIIPAPMDLAEHEERAALRWLPSHDGAGQVRQALREALGLLMGA